MSFQISTNRPVFCVIGAGNGGLAMALGIRAHTSREWLYLAYSAAGKDLYEAMHANAGYKGIKAPVTLNHRYITEDIPMSLVPLASIGEMLGVETPTIRSIVQLAGVLHGRDYWAEGRTVDKLGIEGMSVREIRILAVEGLFKAETSIRERSVVASSPLLARKAGEGGVLIFDKRC